jgi:hypothetical protein
MARLVFIEFPYEVGIARRSHNRKAASREAARRSAPNIGGVTCKRSTTGAPAIKGVRPKARRMLTSAARYFFLPEPKVGCHPAVFWLGAAAMVLIFSFFGFLVSRLPFCSPLAMSISLWCVVGVVDGAGVEM